MPALNSTPSPLLSTYGFSAAFFQPYVATPRPAAVDEAAEPGPGICYCEATHGSHADFCRSLDFPVYQNEVRQGLDFLGNFCLLHRMPDAGSIIQRFNLFFSLRFDRAYFDTHAHLVDSAGKRALDNICAMVRDERISLDTRQSAIRDLSRGLSVCASGVTANLIAADRELTLSSEGIRPALWKVKHDLTHDILLQAVSAEHKNARRYVNNEIHYFNTAWNHVAESVGLEKIPDLMARTLQAAFLARCKTEVLAALTPVRLARVMAKQCLDIFTSGLAARKISCAGDYTVRTHEAFGELLLQVRQRYRLGADTLRLHAFAWLDDDGLRYELRRDSSLIARDLLIAMNSEHLLSEAPIDWGAWQSAAGEQYALYTFGTDLAWRARRYGDFARTSAWDANAEVEPVTISDLHAWCAVWRQNGHPPPTAVRQALLVAGPADFAAIPQDWLGDPDTLRVLLAMSNRELVQRCLQAGFTCFVNAFSSAERDTLIDNHMDAGEAVLRLACRWYGDPWTLMGAPRDAKGRSRLQQWMASDNTKAIEALLGTVDGTPYLATGKGVAASKVFLVLRGLESMPMLAEAMSARNIQAIDAWRRLASHPAVIGHIKHRLTQLLLDAMRRCAMLSMQAPQVIEAFHRIVADPAILPHIARDLPELLAGKSLDGIPGLSMALRAGLATNVSAFHAILVDPAILPHIKHKLPELLAACSPDGCTGLDGALAHGNAASIWAFHVLLTDPKILPHILHRLPKLLVTKVRDGKSGLPAALRLNRHMVIRALGRLLSDSLILPHIKHLLPKLLAAKTYDGTPGLAWALDYGNALAINAYHDVLADPRIVPHIARVLPKLLAAKQRAGTPGLWLALLNNRDGAVTAFGYMLADPNILPYIQHVLVDLLAARDASGRTALAKAAEEGRFHAMANFLAILEQPTIAPNIESGMTEILPVLRIETPTSALREAPPSRGGRPAPWMSVREFLHSLAVRWRGQRGA